MNCVNIVNINGSVFDILHILRKFLFSGLKRYVTEILKEKMNSVNIVNVNGTISEILQILKNLHFQTLKGMFV